MTCMRAQSRRDSTTDCGVSCPLESEKSPYTYHGKKRCCHFFSAVFDQILLILAGKDDIHKSLAEFEIRPDPTTDHRVSCPRASKNRFCHFFSVAIYLIHFKFVGIEDMHYT